MGYGRRRPIVVELGAGVGFPSFAFAKALRYHRKRDNTSNGAQVCDESDNNSMPIAVATDVSNLSVALIASNARINDVSDDGIKMRLNHTDTSELLHLTQQFVDGFDVIIGSSLQSFFDNMSRKDALLWQVLMRYCRMITKRQLLYFLMSRLEMRESNFQLCLDSNAFDEFQVITLG